MLDDQIDADLDPELIREMQQKGSTFVSNVLGVEPYDYQRRFLDIDNRRRCFVAGRQVGKSTVMSWIAIWKWATNRDHDVLIFAPSHRQAVEFMDRVKSEIDTWLDHPEEYGITHVTKTELEGAHGSRLVALTTAGSGDTIRGYTSDTVIIDEAAFVETEFITSVISPMLLRTEGEFILGGTPWGQSGFLYDKFHDDRWFSIQVQTPECPDISMDQIEEMKDDLSQTEYRREVLGEFVEKENAAFPEAIIKSAIYRGEGPEDVYPEYDGGPCWLGVDPARYGDDRAVFTSIDESGNVFDVVVKERTSIPAVEGEVRRLDGQWGYEKILIDETGLGGGPIDDLYDKINVDGLTFTLQSKQEIYQNLKRALEDEAVTIPDDKSFVRELRDMEYETTVRGNMKFHAPEDGRDDFVDSLALAYWARSEETLADPADRMYSFADPPEAQRQRESGSPGARGYSFGDGI